MTGILPLQQELIDRLCARMAKRGMNQSDVAQLSGFTKKHVNRVLNGGTLGTLDTWQRLFDATDAMPLGTKTCALCGRSGTQAFALDGDEVRCSNWPACRDRQLRTHSRAVGGPLGE